MLAQVLRKNHSTVLSSLGHAVSNTAPAWNEARGRPEDVSRGFFSHIFTRAQPPTKMTLQLPTDLDARLSQQRSIQNRMPKVPESVADLQIEFSATPSARLMRHITRAIPRSVRTLTLLDVRDEVEKDARPQDRTAMFDVLLRRMPLRNVKRLVLRDLHLSYDEWAFLLEHRGSCDVDVSRDAIITTLAMQKLSPREFCEAIAQFRHQAAVRSQQAATHASTSGMLLGGAVGHHFGQRNFWAGASHDRGDHLLVAAQSEARADDEPCGMMYEQGYDTDL